MRILTVIYEFPPIGGGGGEPRTIFAGTRGARHDVTVLTAHMRASISRSCGRVSRDQDLLYPDSILPRKFFHDVSLRCLPDLGAVSV